MKIEPFTVSGNYDIKTKSANMKIQKFFQKIKKLWRRFWRNKNRNVKRPLTKTAEISKNPFSDRDGSKVRNKFFNYYSDFQKKTIIIRIIIEEYNKNNMRIFYYSRKK